MIRFSCSKLVIELWSCLHEATLITISGCLYLFLKFLSISKHQYYLASWPVSYSFLDQLKNSCKLGQTCWLVICRFTVTIQMVLVSRCKGVLMRQWGGPWWTSWSCNEGFYSSFSFTLFCFPGFEFVLIVLFMENLVSNYFVVAITKTPINHIGPVYLRGQIEFLWSIVHLIWFTDI